MGRHCAMRRSGSSASGEPNQPDPFVSIACGEAGGWLQYDLVSSRSTTGWVELWDITTTSELLQHKDISPVSEGETFGVFEHHPVESHSYMVRTQLQWYPTHDSTSYP
jgi:hypothetical protein